MNSASGGVFAAIAFDFLSKGGVVCGAVLEKGVVRHKIIKTSEDLILLQGTKYQQSNLVGVYVNVYQYLKLGVDVLFSGLSCQVAALLSFLGNRTFSGKLLTIDLICAGAQSCLSLDLFVSSNKDLEIVSYRDKIDGWKSVGFSYNLRVKNKNGNIYSLGANNLIIAGFNSKLLKCTACLDCKFRGLGRKSDITIGDFWKDISFPEQHYKGISVAIVHSVDGERALACGQMYSKKSTFEDVLRGNPNVEEKEVVKSKLYFGLKHSLCFILKILIVLSDKCSFNGMSNLGLVFIKIFSKLEKKLSQI